MTTGAGALNLCVTGVFRAERHGDKCIPEDRGAAKRLFARLLYPKKH